MINPERIRRDFPALSGRVYLNTAAEGVPPTQVGQALTAYWHDKLLGMDGRDAHFAVEARCREAAGSMIGLDASEIAFCSCSAEAYNLLSSALNLQPGDEVVINDLDFPSGATPWLRSAQAKVKLWRSSQGALRLKELELLLGDRTRLVQVSLVSFYNGFRLDLTALRRCVGQLAPRAVLSVDVTQALGRCDVAGADADIVISSTHKWVLGIHGGCIVGVPSRSAERLTTRAGGWYNLVDPFSDDRFARASSKPGAASYAVGMPGFAPIYALNAGLRYLEAIGIDAIVRHADPLVARLHAGLLELGLAPLAPFDASFSSGIVAFRHPASERIYHSLRRENIHVMHHAGRIRVAVHGYNLADDVECLLDALRRACTGEASHEAR